MCAPDPNRGNHHALGLVAKCPGICCHSFNCVDFIRLVLCLHKQVIESHVTAGLHTTRLKGRCHHGHSRCCHKTHKYDVTLSLCMLLRVCKDVVEHCPITSRHGNVTLSLCFFVRDCRRAYLCKRWDSPAAVGE